MKQPLSVYFSVEKENRAIRVRSEFNASLSLVWQAWTTPELLDRWWGPSPWRAETQTMDFREGGYWLYAMVGPEGERQWSRADYISIVHEKFFTAKDGFCDENGTFDPEFPQNLWETRFIETESKVMVEITLTFYTFADLEQTLAMGFREGFTTGLNQLDELLPVILPEGRQ